MWLFLTFPACLLVDDYDLDGFTADEGDCAPENPTIFPGAEDPEGDGTDTDCDGVDGVNPCTIDEGGWVDLLEADDPNGDGGGYVFDIKSFQYQLNETNLLLRATSWDEFSLDHGEFQIDMHIDNDWVGFNLSYDAVYPDPSPVQLWSSLNDWSGPMDDGESIVYVCDEDSRESIVIGADLVDLGMLQTWLRAYVQVGWWEPEPGSYEDEAPDDVRSNWSTICVTSEPYPVVIDDGIVDDADGGDGDGVIEVGEIIDFALPIELYCGDTAGNLTAVAEAGTFNQTTVTLLVDSATYNGGQPATLGQVLSPSNPIRFRVEESSVVGSDVLTIEVTFSDANGYVEHESYAFDVYEASM